RYANLGDGVTEEALNALARRIIPPRECDASAGRQGSYALGDSKFRPGKMSKPESADDRVKRMIRKWEMFYVSFTVFDRRVQLLRQFYHLRRQINADRACAAICGFGCKSTRPARDIQQTCTGLQMHGVEKRMGSQSSHRRKKCVIAPCQGI